MRRSGRLGIGLCLVAALIVFVPRGAAARTDDAYLAGYAAAVLERELQLRDAVVSVTRGVVVVRADVSGVTRERVVAALASIPGVVRVDVLAPDEHSQHDATTVSTSVGAPLPQILPSDGLFEALRADPRWPHFSVAYHSYRREGGEARLDNVGTTSFGETIPLYRDAGPFDGLWELGLQAGVFAVFDLDAPSSDLVNADYLGGATLAYRLGAFSLIQRIFHQSSHLGDEYLLRTDTDRVNLSYEQADLRLSYDVLDVLRLYAGGGAILRRQPSDLDRWSSQYGAEIDLPVGWPLRPVAAVDVQHREETDWNTDLSVRAGFELEDLSMASRRVLLLGEWYDGHSPNGQFFDEKIEFFGVGAHLLF